MLFVSDLDVMLLILNPVETRPFGLNIDRFGGALVIVLPLKDIFNSKYEPLAKGGLLFVKLNVTFARWPILISMFSLTTVPLVRVAFMLTLILPVELGAVRLSSK